MTERVLCVDFGSTFTKAALVDTGSGDLVATATHRTTIGTDLMEALDGIRARFGAPDVELLACSSAGGGLRVGVVGHEELVTGEAGRRVATSSGGWVVHVASGPLSDTRGLLAARPDVVLLVGGTDGGNAKVLRANARTLAQARLEIPIVVAGNRDCRDEIAAMFAETDTPCVVTENVLPEIGVVRPDAARAAIREMFVRHVIGGKHLSRRDEFTRIVVGATPDLVLKGVELLAESTTGDVAVVDVGGATTDVHSVTRLDDDSHEVVATLPVSRTVEGDLGLRWNAVGVVEAAVDLG
ncbi:MAG TPA: glutamate mutase L, partial [Actinopolymorphaceae bacterium]